MRHRSGLPVIMSLLWAGSAPAASVPNQTAWAAGTRWQFETSFMGFPEAWVYVPASYSTRVPGKRGLVFHLMGCGQRAFQVAQAGGWPEAAEAFGLVVVVPGVAAPAHPNRDAAQVECFNYGYDGAYGVRNPTRTDADHAALIAAARALPTDARASAWAIDPDQVYVAGLSAGGAVAVQVGCMAPDLFAGVATAAAPGLGTAQGTAVMPPPAGFGKDSVKRLCTDWASGSGHPDALSKLSQQVYAIVSDDNGLPAGSGPLDTSKFNNQRIWDGDKFCPHVYGDTRAAAFSELLGVSVSQRQVAVGTGTGIGCPGGENSAGDGGEVQCVIADFVTRPWTAWADVYTDAAGYTRLVRIEQDTLRHSWPSGPLSGVDAEATPTRTELRAGGYIDTTTGEFDTSRTGSAANGQYGTIYFNHQALDFPMFVAALWTNNNPRLGPPVGLDQPVVVQDLLLTPAEAAGTFSLQVSGTARDPDPDDAVDAVTIAAVGAGGQGPAAQTISGSGAAALPFSARFLGLAAGAYTVRIEVAQAGGAPVTVTRAITLGGPANLPPVVTAAAGAPSGLDCVAVTGTAQDPDGAAASVEVTLMGVGVTAVAVAQGSWQFERCGLANGTYTVFATALDDAGATSAEVGPTQVTVSGGRLEEAVGTLTEHIEAGRVVRFTQQWLDLRAAHCTQVDVVTWSCDPFSLYRCAGDPAWTDARPACGDSAVAEVAVTLEASADRPEAPTGEVCSLDFALGNAGPDACRRG